MPSSRSTFEVTGATDTELLRAVLSKVIAGVLERHEVPITTAVAATDDGLTVSCHTVSAAAILPTGAIPKGVSRQNSQCERLPSGWWCTVRIDV
jgi:hypothetical protein